MKLASIEQICPETPAWITECEKLKSESTLAGMVLIALQMGLWLARAVLESEIQRRAEEPSKWGTCRAQTSVERMANATDRNDGGANLLKA